MTFGIYDTLSKSWLLCQFDEEQYNTAVAIAAERNTKYNSKSKRDKDYAALYKRYEVRLLREVANV